MAASVVLPVRWISAITARVVALALVACSDRAVRARAAVSALPPDGRLRHPSFGSSGSGSWSRSRHLAFDFTRHFFQPRRIGRAGDQGAQLGGNRRFTRWLSFAVSLQLGPSVAAQGMGGHVSPSFRHGIPCLSRKRARLHAGCRGALLAAQDGDTGRATPLPGGEEARPPNCRNRRKSRGSQARRSATGRGRWIPARMVCNIYRCKAPIRGA